MSFALDQLSQWMAAPSEGEHLEFKEAKSSYDFDDLAHYCCAMANEGGGKFVLGVTDKLPRRVVGSSAFANLEKVKGDLYQRLRFRVRVEEIQHPDGRVVVFDNPSRPIGVALRVDRIYWMRAGESLTEMSDDKLREIFAEGQPDFSRDFCRGATEQDLDAPAIEDFRNRWIQKSKNQKLAAIPHNQLLKDAELIDGDEVTYAALVLFGTRQALGKYLPNAEVVFEYRSQEASIPSQQRENFREGLFLIYDRIWELVNRRNDMQHYQDGLFVHDIPTFNEEVIREALLNAVSHRDYRMPESVFVRQFPKKIQFVSPGGFPQGITPENCLYRQAPRNRRIAEALERCGMVERSGQGFDKIYSQCIREAKSLPEFMGTDDYQVCLQLSGVVQDPAFIRFLEKVGSAVQQSFYLDDLLVLDFLRQEKPIPDRLTERLEPLRECGVIELVSRGRSPRYILSKKFYDFSGKRGAYTRKRGLDRETNKELIIKHLGHHKRGLITEFEQALPSLSRNQIHSLLCDLKAEKRIVHFGGKKYGHWELAGI
jgi:ATP-dependent DNA helicase RecG